MVKPSTTLPVAEKLDQYFRQIERVILSRQDPYTGLLPASTAVTTHGDYTDAWVRDNVYAIISVWGLGIAYRKSGADSGRAYLLEQSVVKLMRGLLLAMMRQADKVERFKRSRSPYDALHAKYDPTSGDTVVADHEWGHLQLDATAVFMLMLAQMIRSGLRIVHGIDEVNFIQNLVYYLGRAYRTPDFGIWERGNKRNDGRAEINASSLGMVKAALEAMRGLNLFGTDRHQSSVIHVVTDEIAQSRITLENLLPRESNSKEVDAALLGVIGYPAFAIEDERLIKETRERILEKLGGRYGCKRFLLDGHQTVLEDTSRLHYEADELKKFEYIESEWPLFFTYLFIGALFRGDYVEATRYRGKLESLSVERDNMWLLPELYYVPPENVEAEKANPTSQHREPNDNIPLIWAQSLYYLGCLIDDGLLSVEDIDPLGRHSRTRVRKRVQVQIALLAEDEKVKRRLSALGYTSETRDDLNGIGVREGRELSRVFSVIGVNKRLQLTGRPMRRMRAMMSSQVYRLRDELVVFIPQFQNQSVFYLNLDNHLFVDQVKAELHYLVRHWDQSGKPLMTLSINQNMLEADDADALVALFQKAVLGEVDGVSVQFGALSDLIHNSGYEVIHELHGFDYMDNAAVTRSTAGGYLSFDRGACKPLPPPDGGTATVSEPTDASVARLTETGNLYEQIDILELIAERHGGDFEVPLAGSKRAVPVKRLIDEVYRKACDVRLWGVIRKAAGLLDKSSDRLDVAVQEIVMRQRQVMAGRGHNRSMTISEILTSREIYALITSACENDVREAQMNQELLLILGNLIKTHPELFKGIITVRTGYLLLLCVNEYAAEHGLDEDRAFESFTRLSPYAIQRRLKGLLGHYQKAVAAADDMQALRYVKPGSDLVFINFSESDDPARPEEVGDWLEWRKQSGTILGLPKSFYEKLWVLLSHSKGVVLGDRYSTRSRLETASIQGAMTAGERSFALLVDGMLNEIYAPEYRYLTIEAIMAMAAFVEVNPGLKFDDHLVLDAIIDNALRLDWLERHPDEEQAFNDDSSAAWEAFYRRPPHEVAGALNHALERLLLSEHRPGENVAIQRTAVESGQSLGL